LDQRAPAEPLSSLNFSRAIPAREDGPAAGGGRYTTPQHLQSPREKMRVKMPHMAKFAPALDEALVAVWRQALVDGLKTVTLDSRSYPVRTTPNKKLRQVDFEHEGESFRGLEQNPKTKSRWAELSRKGAKVMQFFEGGKYIAVVVDGKVTHYSAPEG